MGEIELANLKLCSMLLFKLLYIASYYHNLSELNALQSICIALEGIPGY